jgi:hypothetical protein
MLVDVHLSKLFSQEFDKIDGLSPLHSLECHLRTALFALCCTIWNEKRVLRNQRAGVIPFLLLGQAHQVFLRDRNALE